MKRLEERVARLEKEHEITVIRMGQMQTAFDLIFAAWAEAMQAGPEDRGAILFAGWQAAAQRMPK